MRKPSRQIEDWKETHTSALPEMEVSGQLDVLVALVPGKEPPVSVEQGARERHWTRQRIGKRTCLAGRQVVTFLTVQSRAV